MKSKLKKMFSGIRSKVAPPVVRQENIVRDAGEKPKKERFLLMAYYDPVGINTVKDTVFELIGLSRYPIDLINLYPAVSLEKKFKFYHYDGLIIHNSVNYFAQTLRRIDSFCNQKIAGFPGVKVMFKQDEHFQHYLLIDYLEETPFDLVATLCPEKDFALFYPPTRLPNLSLINYYTAYVKEAQKTLPYHNVDNRPIDVGYRGSIQPLVAGRLSWEKRQIGWEFEKHAQKRGLKMDISSRWEDRIMGDDWYKFMGGCKALLGVESGASIVDLDGSVTRSYDSFVKLHPDATDIEVLEHLAPYERGPQYRVISPRHLEAAACFCVQVMYEDGFQGVFEKNRHYIALDRDFGNVDEVIDRILDEKERVRITENAYRDIILNPKYSYAHFVEKFDRALDDLFQDKEKRVLYG